MSDITKCYGHDEEKNICPIRENCWRFMCPSGTIQGYFIQMPYDSNAKKCECYLHKDEQKQN